jgi:hypothetical protein
MNFWCVSGSIWQSICTIRPPAVASAAKKGKGEEEEKEEKEKGRESTLSLVTARIAWTGGRLPLLLM